MANVVTLRPLFLPKHLFACPNCLRTPKHLQALKHLEMNLDRSELENLAMLARLTVDEAVFDDVGQGINDILNLVEQLQTVDTSGVEPMAHPLDAVQRLRADEVTEGNEREAFQAIAPQTEAGLYLVPKVIE